MSISNLDGPKLSQSVFENARRKAQKLFENQGLSLQMAQNSAALELGFNGWAQFLSVERKWYEASLQMSFEDITENSPLREFYKTGEGKENQRKAIVSGNRKILAHYGIDYAIFEPTETGMKKCILDATQPVRHLFEQTDLHYYYQQSQGPEHKEVLTAFFVRDNRIEKTTASLYRPKTKQGDPRMWFRGLPSYANPGDQIAIIVHKESLYLLILSRQALPLAEEVSENKIATLLSELISHDSAVPMELLRKLKEIAKNSIKTEKTGSTAVGHAIETALGIAANSDKKPDYKGIEIKSGRVGKNGKYMSRNTLFAQVADWSLSQCKSSAEILDTFGYDRDGLRRLNCTVQVGKTNTQGLKFDYDPKSDLLREVHEEFGYVATWPGKLLRGRLLEKHAETFWIAVESTLDPESGKESFKLVSVVHTKSPLENQLMPLIESGVVTMDHLIKREEGRVSERGPLFKIAKSNLALLFPTPLHYSLNEE